MPDMPVSFPPLPLPSPPPPFSSWTRLSFSAPSPHQPSCHSAYEVLCAEPSADLFILLLFILYPQQKSLTSLHSCFLQIIDPASF
jgi:hypothetical protein